MLHSNVNAFSRQKSIIYFNYCFVLMLLIFPQLLMVIDKSMFENRGRLHSKGNDPEQSVSPAKLKQERNYF